MFEFKPQKVFITLPPSPHLQVLFDDIGPSLIRLSSPELQLRLLLHFSSFLGLPVHSAPPSALCHPELLLENLSLLTQGEHHTRPARISCSAHTKHCLDERNHVFSTGNDLQHPLTSYDLPDPGVNSVGHMTTLQGTRKWAGLGRQGEKFLTNVFNTMQPLLPPHHRAVLSLSWIQYEKLKVFCLTLTAACKSLDPPFTSLYVAFKKPELLMIF